MKCYPKYLFLPTQEMISAMKIRLLPSRGKQHKILRDACDLNALIGFAEKSPENIKSLKGIKHGKLVITTSSY